MYIDPGEEMARRWDCEILEKQDPLAMWTFFTNSMVSMLDVNSAFHIIDHQGHLVRMYYLFALMSVTPVSIGKTSKYLIAVNNESYLFRNIHCIQKANKALKYQYIGDKVYIEPLPLIFKVDENFSDHQTYRVPEVLGGSALATTIFADD